MSEKEKPTIGDGDLGPGMSEHDRRLFFPTEVERLEDRVRDAEAAATQRDRIAGLRERIAGLGEGDRARAGGGSGPIATPAEARAAYQEHGSDRKAARALGISRTQLRRLRGLEG